MHHLFDLATAVMGLGRLVLTQFPARGSPWYNFGIAMLCVSVLGPILFACLG
jgi:hypothetical protein